jgi:hypothetical protein
MTANGGPDNTQDDLCLVGGIRRGRMLMFTREGSGYVTWPFGRLSSSTQGITLKARTPVIRWLISHASGDIRQLSRNPGIVIPWREIRSIERNGTGASGVIIHAADGTDWYFFTFARRDVDKIIKAYHRCYSCVGAAGSSD